MIKFILQHIIINFENIAGDLHNQALEITNLMTVGSYLFVVILLPLIVIVYDDIYGPLIDGVNLYVVFIIVMPILVITPAFIYACFKNSKYGKVALNWQLQLAVRYLKICETSAVYTKALLPDIQLNERSNISWYCQLAGSSKDGFGFFPFLSSNKGIFPTSKPLITQDIDVNIFMENLILNEKENLLFHSPGFCHIKIDSNLSSHEYFKDCIVFDGSNYLLSGHHIMNKMAGSLRGEIEFNYPALTYKTILDGPYGKFRFDSDIVFGIKLSSWPEAAQNWSKRVKKMLPVHVIESVHKKCCYLVHKHCPYNQIRNDLDWRLSFAEAETILFQYHSEKQALKLVYVILKFAIKLYSHDKFSPYVALKSYHLKTTFLWVAEKEKSLKDFDLYKIQDNKTLGELMLHVIKEYRQSLYLGKLDHYFIPGINLLDIYSQDERTVAMRLMDEFLERPLNIVSRFDNAHIVLWKREQWHIVITFFAAGALFFTQYADHDLFGPTSIADQIFMIGRIFIILFIIYIFLDR
uniref:Uncharacterized protein n=1 Tax=Clytia hemisphaerica TaxID=252671 RepID=A0A7M5WTR9_9CNID